ncbi:MAG: WD40 repeat domain-containing protein [Acidobacteriota bacterium]|nr:WD40 repeat domain-containing protein [Acidobacteriota bacterium]
MPRVSLRQLLLPLLLLGATVAGAQALRIRASLVRTLAPHTRELREVAFSTNSQWLATSSVDGDVKLWRVADGKLLRTMRHPAGVTSVRFAPGDDVIVTGAYDGIVRVWRTADGKLLRVLRGHEGTVWSVAVRPDGQQIATSGEDATVRLWPLNGGGPAKILRGHTLNVWAVAYAPNGRLLVSGSFDRTVKVWRTDNGALLRTMTDARQAVVGVAFSSDGQTIAGGSDDSTVRLWRVTDGRLLRTLSGSEHVYSVAFSGDGHWLASAGRERGALGTLWKEMTGNHFRRSNAATVRLWRVSDGALQQELAAHADDVRYVAVSRDNRWLATSSEDRTVKLFRLAVSK